MIKEKSCGAVVYYIENGIYYFLIEKMKKGHFSLPKGHIEENESEVQTALREIKEETNLDVFIDTSFKEITTYSPYENCIKDVIFFIAKTDSNKTINQASEVSDIKFLKFDEAYKKLTYQSDKEVLLKAYLYIIKTSFNKVVLLGCPGSGKSYLSKYLTNYLSLPLYHLDNLYWYGNWQHIEKQEFIEKQEEIMKTSNWIIDGHFNHTITNRIKKCDFIIYFDINPKTCINNINHRIKYHNKRDDMPCVETEFNDHFKDCIMHFKENNHPLIMENVNKFNKNIMTIKNKKQLKLIVNYLKDNTK